MILKSRYITAPGPKFSPKGGGMSGDYELERPAFGASRAMVYQKTDVNNRERDETTLHHTCRIKSKPSTIRYCLEFQPRRDDI